MILAVAAAPGANIRLMFQAIARLPLAGQFEVEKLGASTGPAGFCDQAMAAVSNEPREGNWRGFGAASSFTRAKRPA